MLCYIGPDSLITSCFVMKQRCCGVGSSAFTGWAAEWKAEFFQAPQLINRSNKHQTIYTHSQPSWIFCLFPDNVEYSHLPQLSLHTQRFIFAWHKGDDPYMHSMLPQPNPAVISNTQRAMFNKSNRIRLIIRSFHMNTTKAEALLEPVSRYWQVKKYESGMYSLQSMTTEG